MKWVPLKRTEVQPGKVAKPTARLSLGPTLNQNRNFVEKKGIKNNQRIKLFLSNNSKTDCFILLTMNKFYEFIFIFAKHNKF